MPMSSLSFLVSSVSQCSRSENHLFPFGKNLGGGEIRQHGGGCGFFLPIRRQWRGKAFLAFFFGTFVREARYILFGWEQKSAWGGDKPSCLSEILSLFSEKLSNDRKYRG